MRVILVLLSLLYLIDGKGGAAGGGRGASGARGGSASRGSSSSSGSRSSSSSSSAARSASASASRPAVPYVAPRVNSAPVRQTSRSSIGAPLLGFGAGALAGALTANRINNAYAPVSYNGNNYYWGRDVVPQNSPLVCTRPLGDVNEVNFDDIMFNDGTRRVISANLRPTEFAWSCGSSDRCCDWSCCADNGYGVSTGPVSRRSAFSSDSTDPSNDSLALPQSTPDTNTSESLVMDGTEDGETFDNDESFRGAIAGWVILGIAVAALIVIVLCIGCYTMKRRRKAAQQSAHNRQTTANSNRDAWSPNLVVPVQLTPPAPSTVPPAYSNVAFSQPTSLLPEKPPAYSTQIPISSTMSEEGTSKRYP